MKTTSLKYLKWDLKQTLSGFSRAIALAGILAAGSASATVVTTLGGGPTNATSRFYGYKDGNTAQDSQFNFPTAVATDPSATLLFVSDYTNNAVRYITLTGNAGTSLTGSFATSTNGVLRPIGVLVDSSTNVYVLNRGNGTTNGSILEYRGVHAADGNPPILLASIAINLTNATAMTMDGLTNFFVTVRSNMVVKIAPGGVKTTVGVITNAKTSLQGITILDNGSLALTDSGNHSIWIMNPGNTSLSNNAIVLTGFNGQGYTPGETNFAQFNQPEGISKAGNNQLVVADRGNNMVRLVDANTGYASRLYGVKSNLWVQGTAQNGIYPGWWDGTVDPNENDVGSVEARQPYGVYVAQDGSVFTSEVYYDIIRKVTVTGLSGPGPLVAPPLFNSPRGIAVDVSGTFLYIADKANNSVDVLDLINNTTTQYLTAADGINSPSAVAVDQLNDLFVLNQGTGGNGNLLEFDTYGNFIGTDLAGLSSPTAMTIDFSGNIFIAELNGAIQELSGITSNTVVTITTNGAVQLQGIALFDDGTIAVSDSGNHVLWQVNPVTKLITRLTGSIGVPGNTISATAAKLNQPHQLIEASGNQILIADTGNNRLSMVSRSGAVTNILKSTNSIVWFGRPGDPYGTNSTKWVSMMAPFGVAIGTAGEVYDSEVVNNDIRKILNTGLAQVPPPVPAPVPGIGWVDYTLPPLVVSLIHTGPTFVFNNDANIQILGSGDSQIYYTVGPTPLASLIPDPNATNGTTAPLYQDGVFSTQVPATIVPPQPDITIKAVGANPGSPNSTVTQTRLQWVTANPLITGVNAAQFSLSDLTTNAQMWFTLDGTDPTNAPPSVGPLLTGATLSLSIVTNTTFKVRAFRTSYQPSAVINTVFSPSNFVPNTISFGFENGEASSDFVGAPGQTFYAPVTLSILPQTVIYSMQFNVTVTNDGPNPAPPITPGAFGFASMLEKPSTDTNGQPVFESIPPIAFISDMVNPPPSGKQVTYDGSTNFVSLETVNTNNNLLGVGWLERFQKTNLFNTIAQDLITFSQAHDTLFTKDKGKVVVGGYAFQLSPSALPGQTYQIQIGRPTATADGIGAPGSSVFIYAPTNGSLGGGVLNTIKIVTAGQRKYIAGDCYPFRWFNAGDFGNTNLENADVQQVFNSAIYGLNSPSFQAPGSDFLDAMDSCGAFGVTNPGTGYFTKAGSLTVDQQNALFNGDYTTMDQIAFGDGTLDVSDVYVTYVRSIDPQRTWYRRFWTNGVLVAEITPNVFNPSAVQQSFGGKFVPAFNFNNLAPVSITNTPLVNFIAGDFQAAAGQTIQIPVTASVFGPYPLRVALLNITVVPLDGSPALTTRISFTLNPPFNNTSAYNPAA